MKKLVGFFVFFLAIFPVFHNQYDQVFATNDFTGPLEIGFVPQDTFVDPEKSIVYMTRQSSNVLYAINYETGIINTLTLPYPAGKLDWYGGKLYVTQHKMPHTNSTTVPLIGAIAEVGAVQFQLIDVFDIHTDPYDITIDKHGFLYVTPGSGQWQHMKVYSLYDKTEITNGHTAHMRQRSPIHYNEVTSKVYTITSDVSPRNVTAFDIDQGKLTGKYNSPYHGQFKLTPNAKISPDGRFMYNFNGVIFRLAPQRPNDLIYHFSLGEVFRDFSFSLEDDLTFAASRDGGVDVFIYDTDFYLYTIKEEVLVHKLQFNEGLIMVYTENGKHFIEYLEDYGPDPLAFVEGYYFQMEDDGEMGLYDFYDGVTSIPRDTLLALVFNQIIFLEDEDHIILTGPNGLVPVEVDDEEGLLFIEPANLTANTDYILTIGKDSISDFFGNVMSEDLVIHFTTEIPAVSNVELRPSAFDKITVQWLPVAGVDGYEIFRATASDGPFRRVATVSNGNAVSHVNGSLDTGTTYYYQVRAFRNIHGKKVYGQFSPIVSAKTRLGKTDAVQAKPSDFNKITVSWSRVAGATGYEIYRSGSRSGTYSRVRTVTSGSTLSFVNGSLDTGKTYYYKVRAFREVNGVKIYGPYSSIVHGKPVLDKTISVKGSSADFNKINISWARTSGANGYEVYRSTSKSGTYSRVRTITNGSTLSFENGNLETERTYYYKVRAYRNVNDKKVFGPFSSTINVKAILARPGNVKGQRVSASSMELSWSRVNGANGYEIFRATSSTGSYSRVGRVTNGSTVKYVDKGLMKGRTFYYKVRAYRDVNGKRVFSTYSSVFTYRVP